MVDLDTLFARSKPSQSFSSLLFSSLLPPTLLLLLLSLTLTLTPKARRNKKKENRNLFAILDTFHGTS